MPLQENLRKPAIIIEDRQAMRILGAWLPMARLLLRNPRLAVTRRRAQKMVLRLLGMVTAMTVASATVVVGVMMDQSASTTADWALYILQIAYCGLILWVVMAFGPALIRIRAAGRED